MKGSRSHGVDLINRHSPKPQRVSIKKKSICSCCKQTTDLY